jgi:hypothetical protein
MRIAGAVKMIQAFVGEIVAGDAAVTYGGEMANGIPRDTRMTKRGGTGANRRGELCTGIEPRRCSSQD